MHEPSTLTHELSCILLLDYKLTLPKYNINDTRFVGLEVCIIGKYALLVLNGTSKFSYSRFFF